MNYFKVTLKYIKAFLLYGFAAFGINMALLFIYFATINPQTIDRFVGIVTAVLSAICSLWLGGYIERSDNDAE